MIKLFTVNISQEKIDDLISEEAQCDKNLLQEGFRYCYSK